MRLGLIFISVMFMLATSGCSEETPSIDEEVYMEVLAELELIHVFHSHTGEKERAAGLINEVWKKYQISEEEFLSSHFIYERDTEGQIRRIQTITEKLTLKHQALEDSLGIRYMDEDY